MDVYRMVLPIYARDKVITDRDKDFLTILFCNEQGLGSLVVHGFYFSNITVEFILQPETNDFVVVKLIST